MSGFKSGLDDLEAIRKRREELFPKEGLQPAEPFISPVDPVVDRPPADGSLEEYYGRGDPVLMRLLRTWNEELKNKRLLEYEEKAHWVELVLP